MAGEIAQLAQAVRFLALDGVEKARSGHPGLPMGMAEVMSVLFRDILKFDATTPGWFDRDRLILSAGHGSMLIYALLYLTGYQRMDRDQLERFRQYGSLTPGHPERGLTPGIEVTSGPLGQGLGNGVGMALGERLLRERFGGECVDHRTYVVVSDGDLMEGVSHEVASLAGHLRLNHLIVLWDDNRISIDGPTGLSVSENTHKRFQAYGWETYEVDGHDSVALQKVLTQVVEDQGRSGPCLIGCRTVIGYGAPTFAGTSRCHGAPLGEKEATATRNNLNWPHPPFAIAEDLLSRWRQIGLQGQALRLAWEQRVHALAPLESECFTQITTCALPDEWEKALEGVRVGFAGQRVSTRKASQVSLEKIVAKIPFMIGGSADLAGSTGTWPSSLEAVSAQTFGGRFIHYGVREFAMATMMNGLAAHGGFLPYGGTFVVFSDYMRSGIRLAALMGVQVIYVLTHDSIGLGEDGPTHQPIEHLPMLRATPNVQVYRPADGIETAECWELAVLNRSGPSVLILTRQEVESVRHESGQGNRCITGGYVLKEASGRRQATLIGTGSEVQVVYRASELLEKEGIKCGVVSLPCWELFEMQSKEFRDRVLGTGGLRVAVEAASPFGWERYVGEHGVILGIDGFGASAPGKVLMEKFGFTPEKVCQVVRGKLAQET